MEGERSVTVVFLEALIDTSPNTWPRWQPGPLTIDGYNGKSQLPASLWSAVVEGSRMRRWHLDLSAPGEATPSSRIIALEALELAGTDSSTFLVAVHLAMNVVERHDAAGMEQLNEDLKTISDIAQVPMRMKADWGRDPSMATSAIVAELVCIPDNTAVFLPPPRFSFSPLNAMPGHLAMFCVITEEPMISAEQVETASAAVLQVPRGEVMVGLNRTIAMSDAGVEAYARTCVVDALMLGVAQRVLLRRLTLLSERLSDPGRHAREAAALSRAIAGYQGIYSWAHADPLPRRSPESWSHTASSPVPARPRSSSRSSQRLHKPRPDGRRMCCWRSSPSWASRSRWRPR